MANHRNVEIVQASDGFRVVSEFDVWTMRGPRQDRDEELMIDDSDAPEFDENAWFI